MSAGDEAARPTSVQATRTTHGAHVGQAWAMVPLSDRHHGLLLNLGSPFTTDRGPLVVALEEAIEHWARQDLERSETRTGALRSLLEDSGAPPADPPREPPAPAADAGDGDGSTPPPAVRRSPPAGSSPARVQLTAAQLADRVRETMGRLGRATPTAIVREGGISRRRAGDVVEILRGSEYVEDGRARGGGTVYRRSHGAAAGATDPPPLPGLPEAADRDPAPAASIERRIKAALRSKPLGASHAEIRDRVNADGTRR